MKTVFGVSRSADGTVLVQGSALKRLFFPLFLGTSFCTPSVFAAENHHESHNHQMEEILVTSALKKSEAQTPSPVNVIDGEKLRETVANTLGETINNQVGVSFSSFGPGVGLPVIRGQSGNRVRVLQNSTGTLDASNVSPDHSNSIEAMLAERIEVVRGPATLLYGNGAIGGVVNVIDNRIPEELPEAISGAFEQRHNTVNDQDTSVFKLDGSIGDLALHLDGFYRDSNNVEIEGLAIREDEEDHDDHDDHEEEENTNGFIGNSNARAKGLTGGVSWIGEKGFIGMSISRLENNYGLPPGAHEHEEEGHGHDHDDDHDDHGDENIRIDLEQTRFDLKGARQLDGFIEEVRGHLTYNDYEHVEIEGGSAGTTFSNEGVEGRLSLDHQGLGNGGGVIGLQVIDREFSAKGDEAFIPTADILSLALFAVEGIDVGKWSHEFGARIETQDIDAERGCSASETTFSTSAATVFNFREDTNLLLSIARSERAATEEELFSNRAGSNCGLSEELIEHIATARAEVGDDNLDTETSTNIEIALRKHMGDVQGQLNIFYNDISDYIFLSDTENVTDEGVMISAYEQQDAKFRGIEAELTTPIWTKDNQRLELTLFGDYVRADFDRGGDVPRITPMRYGAELAYTTEAWIIKLRVTDVDEQDKVAANEFETDGYTLVSLYADYHLHLSGQEVVVFAKGNNLLDEEVRNHTSLLKNFAPEPGMGFEVGVRLQF